MPRAHHADEAVSEQTRSIRLGPKVSTNPSLVRSVNVRARSADLIAAALVLVAFAVVVVGRALVARQPASRAQG
jgi:hypothetical protein